MPHWWHALEITVGSMETSRHASLLAALLEAEERTLPNTWQRSALRIRALIRFGGDAFETLREVARLEELAETDLVTDAPREGRGGRD